MPCLTQILNRLQRFTTNHEIKFIVDWRHPLYRCLICQHFVTNPNEHQRYDHHQRIHVRQLKPEPSQLLFLLDACSPPLHDDFEKDLPIYQQRNVSLDSLTAPYLQVWESV